MTSRILKKQLKTIINNFAEKKSFRDFVEFPSNSNGKFKHTCGPKLPDVNVCFKYEKRAIMNIMVGNA